MPQPILDLLGQLADLPQIAQIEHIGFIENLKEEPRPLVRAEHLRCPLVELRDDGRLFETAGDDMLIRKDDRERQCIVAVLAAIDGDIGQDHDRVILNIRMRTLLIVESGTQEIGINLCEGTDDLQLVRRRIDDIDPCPFGQRLE